MLMVFGDHDAGFAHDDTLARTIGIAPTDIARTLNDRIPLFIRVPARAGSSAGRSVEGADAVERPLTGVVTLPAGQTDVAPTLLSRLGIDASPLPFLGRNLLGAPGESISRNGCASVER
jgi:hypothetical protein